MEADAPEMSFFFQDERKENWGKNPGENQYLRDV